MNVAAGGRHVGEINNDAVHTSGEALFLFSLGVGGMCVAAVFAVVVAEPDARSPAAAAQYSQIMFWGVVLLTLSDSRMLYNKMSRWTLTAALALTSLRCHLPIVRAVLLLVSLHVAGPRAAVLATSSEARKRLPSRLSRAAQLCWLHDLAGGDSLDDDDGPLPAAVIPQEGPARIKWMSHTLFQGLTSGFVLVGVVWVCRRGLCNAVATRSHQAFAAADNDEGVDGDPEWLMIIAAVVGVVVICAVMQIADALFRFPMLLLTMHPRVTTPMFDAPWRAQSVSDLWCTRFGGPLRDLAKSGARALGFSDEAGMPAAAMIFEGVTWTAVALAAGATSSTGASILALFATHAVFIAVDIASGMSAGRRVLMWSAAAATAPLLGWVFIAPLRDTCAVLG